MPPFLAKGQQVLGSGEKRSAIILFNLLNPVRMYATMGSFPYFLPVWKSKNWILLNSMATKAAGRINLLDVKQKFENLNIVYILKPVMGTSQEMQDEFSKSPLSNKNMIGP